MRDLIDNLVKTIKELRNIDWFWILIYIAISALITHVFESGTRGFAFLLAIPLVALGLYLANQRTSALIKQTKTDSDRLLTETFTKSIELLGSDKEETKQGAIYALENIAKESDDYTVVVINTLCAFIRNNRPLSEAERKEKQGLVDDNPEEARIDKKRSNKKKIKLVTAIEAAVKVIAKISPKLASGNNRRIYNLSNISVAEVDFSNANLSDFNLSDSNFKDCIFEKVKFFNSSLIGSKFFNKTDFKGATFNNKTEVQKADFSDVINLDLQQINKAQSNENTKLPKDK